MFRLPPPPLFTLPPPPMLQIDSFDTKLLFRLSCSSIRQQQPRQILNLRLIVIGCVFLLIIALLSTLLFILIQLYRQRKSLFPNHEKKLSPTALPCKLSMNGSRSYETISSKQTDPYVESIDTSATTYSTDPSHVIYLHCPQGSDYSTMSSSPYYHTLDYISP